VEGGVIVKNTGGVPMKTENIHNILVIISKAKRKVWEKMRKSCHFYEDGECGYNTQRKDDDIVGFVDCTFETCPLLEEKK